MGGVTTIAIGMMLLALFASHDQVIVGCVVAVLSIPVALLVETLSMRWKKG